MAARRKTSQKFGSHMSIAGGLENAFFRARDVGCDCLQIFVKNQRQWTAKPLTEAQISAYKAAEKETGIGPVVAHASYLLNLASPVDANRTQSIRALIDELQRCEALGVIGLVVHPGAHMGEGVEAGITRIAASIDEAHRATRGYHCRVLLETTAGQGSSIGHTAEQIADIIQRVKAPERVGVCLDTCHLFVAGYDLRDETAYEQLITAMKKQFGLDRILCIHMNDSKGELGSRLDRHEHINAGRIGRKGFVRLLNDKRLAHIPRILETEKGKDDRGRDYDKLNLKKLRDMVA